MTGPSTPPAPGHRYVVQRHRARRLHYDFRLELDGVLVSWAVPKGPTLAPGVRRMAVRVEDHELGYYDFEGVIGAGEYGAGDVIVWDWGTWHPDPSTDAAEALGRGDLHFDLDGTKLHGRFVLIQRGRAPQDWFLLKKNDAAAVAGWDAEQHPHSVKTGRTNDDLHSPARQPASGERQEGDTTMADLDDRKRAKIPTEEFGLPEKAKTKSAKKESGNYPMPDKAHARNAKARAAQQVKAGNLSKSDQERIDRKADRILDGDSAKKSSTKKSTGKKSSPKKSTGKKSTAKKSSAKKTAS